MTSLRTSTERIRMRLRAQVKEFIGNGHVSGSFAEMPLHELKDRLRYILKACSLEEQRTLQISRAGEEERFLDDLINETLGLGPLDALFKDPTITEIMINGPKQIFVERAGRVQPTNAQFRDTNHLMVTIERMLDPMGLSVNESAPLCDASLPDGSRINVIIPPLVLNGPVVTIRRKLRTWEMPDYVATGSLDAQVAEFLQACVRAKVNIIFSGGTSTGKTTLVAILSGAIPPDERIITIENSPELELPNRTHWIRLVSKSSNLEGRGEIPLRTLVRNALRMRPDRIILGEARGGEALDVVQAMHSGHDGFLTMLHANSPTAALERLQTLMQLSGIELSPATCRMQIASAVDLIVHLGRFVDGSRRIVTISQVAGIGPDGFILEDMFVFETQGFSSDDRLQGGCRYTGAKPIFLEKFTLNNIPMPSWMTR